MAVKYAVYCTLVFVLTFSLTHAQDANLDKGDQYLAKMDYPKAIKYYQKAIDKDSANIIAREKMAHACMEMGDYKSAEDLYRQLCATKQADNIDKFYYGQALRNNGKYLAADSAYKAYARVATSDPRAQEFSNFAEEIKPLIRDAHSVEITNIPENSNGSDVGPTFCVYDLCFSSSRAKTSLTKHRDLMSGKGFYDLYLLHAGAPGEGGEIHKLKGKINKKLTEGPATFSHNGREIIFTATNYKVKSKDGSNKLGLYHARYDSLSKKWKDIAPLNINNYDYNFAHPSLSKDGKKLFFVSDMPGGFGESDIYVCTKLADKWSDPVNLGKDLNTSGNEMFPFIAEDNTLYFASDCRVGLGGLDIYSAVMIEGKWTDVRNMGSPINTPYDDFGYITDQSQRAGYFVSNRPGGLGSDDIYHYVVRTRPVCAVVYDSLTKEPIDGVTIDIYNPDSSKIEIVNGAKGDFCMEFLPGKDYNITARKAGYGQYRGAFHVASILNQNFSILLPHREAASGVDVTVDIGTKDGGKIKDATAFLVNKKTGAVLEQKSNDGGVVKFDAAPDQEYDLKVVKNVPKSEGAYEKLIKTISTMGLKPSMSVKESVQLGHYDANYVFNLPNVYFGHNSFEIKAETARDLDKVAEVMKTFPGMEVELSSYTDAKGNPDYNMQLSARRARACLDYLAAKGIDEKRLVAIGYGDKKILNRCTRNVTCSDAEHAVNRRAEFKVLKLE